MAVRLVHSAVPTAIATGNFTSTEPRLVSTPCAIPIAQIVAAPFGCDKRRGAFTASSSHDASPLGSCGGGADLGPGNYRRASGRYRSDRLASIAGSGIRRHRGRMTTQHDVRDSSSHERGGRAGGEDGRGSERGCRPAFSVPIGLVFLALDTSGAVPVSSRHEGQADALHVIH